MESGNFALTEVLGWSAFDEGVVVVPAVEIEVFGVGAAVVVVCVSPTLGDGTDSDVAVTVLFSCAAV